MNDLTPETIAELRRVADAATPGPGDDPEIIERWWDAGDLALYPVSYWWRTLRKMGAAMSCDDRDDALGLLDGGPCAQLVTVTGRVRSA